MEITSKELKTASYKVAASNDGYNIEAVVTIGSNSQVTTIEGGSINKEGVFVANFSQFGNNLNVNYAEVTNVTEQQEVIALIDAFKTIVTEE